MDTLGTEVSIKAADNDFKECEVAAVSKFKRFTSAYALFYHMDNVRGARVEAPDIQKSFVDKANYGLGPQGTLYYNDKKELTGSAYYNVTFTKTPDHTPNCNIIILFFKTREESQDTLFAQFRGRWDTKSALGPGVLVEGAQGTWNDSKLVPSFANINKDSNAKAVTITVASIRKQIAFDIPDNIDISNSVRVDGQMLTNDVGLITNDTKSIVSWDRGRIVFHPENSDTSIVVAVFLPIETTDSSALKNVDKFLSRVAIATWKDT